jgi:hypothetical protein
MNIPELEAWFEELSVKRAAVSWDGDRYRTEEAAAWMAEAEAAVASAFPPGHPARVPFLQAKQRAETIKLIDVGHRPHFQSIVGAFEAARSMLKAGRLRGLAEGIQAETVGELLDQASSFLADGYVVAAAVIAGGALETHLAHLCQRSGVSWPGDGSISKYNGALGAARKQGISVYSTNDGKSVEAWGGMRNEAAHAPTSFNRSAQEVSLMIEGIRQFLTRNP